jgi:hypothetical protein
VDLERPNDSWELILRNHSKKTSGTSDKIEVCQQSSFFRTINSKRDSKLLNWWVTLLTIWTRENSIQWYHLPSFKMKMNKQKEFSKLKTIIRRTKRTNLFLTLIKKCYQCHWQPQDWADLWRKGVNWRIKMC